MITARCTDADAWCRSMLTFGGHVVGLLQVVAVLVYPGVMGTQLIRYQRVHLSIKQCDVFTRRTRNSNSSIIAA